MSFEYHRSGDGVQEDFITFKILTAKRFYGIKITDEVAQEAMKNTDSLCRVLDNLFYVLANMVTADLLVRDEI